MPVFFCENFEEGFLPESEAVHAQAFRLSQGDIVTLADGLGNFAQVVLGRKEKNKQFFDIQTLSRDIPRPYRIHLLVAPPKNPDRIEWMCEKLVEVGIDSISFVFSRYSERKKVDLQRLRRICIAAMKQSRRAWLPRLGQFELTETFLTTIEEQRRFVLDRMGVAVSEQMCNSGDGFCVLVGPEGGWTQEELELFDSCRFEKVSLSSHILRTETAALAGCLAIHLLKK